MGASFSSSSPPEEPVQTQQLAPRKQITYLVEDDYLEEGNRIKEAMSQNQNRSSKAKSKKHYAKPIHLFNGLEKSTPPSRSTPEFSPEVRVAILQNQMVKLNDSLLFAKYSVFSDVPSRILFAGSLENAIISYGRKTQISGIRRRVRCRYRYDR